MTYRRDHNRYYHSGSVDLGVMVMKRYSILLKDSELEPHNQIQFSVIPKTSVFSEGASHSSAVNIVSVFHATMTGRCSEFEDTKLIYGSESIISLDMRQTLANCLSYSNDRSCVVRIFVSWESYEILFQWNSA